MRASVGVSVREKPHFDQIFEDELRVIVIYSGKWITFLLIVTLNSTKAKTIFNKWFLFEAK